MSNIFLPIPASENQSGHDRPFLKETIQIVFKIEEKGRRKQGKKEVEEKEILHFD